MQLRALWLIALIGCDRGQPKDRAPAPLPPVSVPATATATAPASSCNLAAIPSRVPAPKRLVAIGDVHGDLAALKSALRAGGAIDATDSWSGGDLVVVQVGDVLDRGDDEQAIIDYVTQLEPQAKAAGGAYIMLLGNHELMNAAGDFRYVTRAGMADFEDVPGTRAGALSPGGPYAKMLAKHNVIAIVGDTVFSHAGVLGDFVTQIDEVNRSSRCWLDGQAGGPDAAPIAQTSEDSPVWTRAVGTDQVDCAQVHASLAALGVKRMVVGHTVQEHISPACDGAVWRIDVGLGKNYGGPIEVLELAPGGPNAPRILTGTR